MTEYNLEVHDSVQSQHSDHVTISFSQVVREVVTTPATTEDFQELIRLLKLAQEQNLDRARVQAQIAATPFDSLRAVLSSPATGNLAQLVSVILAAVALVVAIRAGSPDPTPTITPQQVEQIIERAVDNVMPDESPNSPSSDSTIHPGPEPE